MSDRFGPHSSQLRVTSVGKYRVYIVCYYLKRAPNYVTFKRNIIHAIYMPNQIQFYSLYYAEFPHLLFQIQGVPKTLRLQE